MIPEFLSEGFAEMTKMSMEEAWDIYRKDALAGVHPDDREFVNRRMEDYLAAGEGPPCEMVYRLKTGSGGYVWVKNSLTLIQSAGGEFRVYAGYHDITKEREEKVQIRKQYNELILQHYRTPGPNALIVGHCNITQNRILEDVYKRQLYGEGEPGKGRWLYGSWIDWEQLKKPEKAEMLEDMKRIIKIRRAHPHLIRPGRMGEETERFCPLDYEADEIRCV